MTRDKELDHLARQITDWPHDKNYVRANYLDSTPVFMTNSHPLTFTKYEVAQRRKKLGLDKEPDTIPARRFKDPDELRAFLQEHYRNWKDLEGYVTFYEEITGTKLLTKEQQVHEDLVQYLHKKTSYTHLNTMARDIYQFFEEKDLLK